MLPTILNTCRDLDISREKSFNEALCEGYHFEVKNDIRCDGSRALYYYGKEHTLFVSHFHTNRVHLLDLESGKLRWFDHHGTTVRSVQVCNHEIITTSWDGTVCVTGFDSLEPRLILTERSMGRCPYAAISPDNESVFSFSYDSDKNPQFTSNTVREWSLVNGKLKKTLPLPGTHLKSDGRFGACKVFDNRLFVVSDTGHFHIYNSITGTLMSEYYYYDELQSLCLFPSFNLLVIGGSEGNIYLHDLCGRRILSKRKAHRYSIPYLLVHPGKPEIMISLGFDGTMKIWKLPELELLESVEVSVDRLWNVTAVNDLLIAGGEAEATCIYDIKNLPQVILKGKLMFYDESYVFVPCCSSSFFTNDPSIMQVRRDDDGTIMEGQFAEYLLNTACNLKVLRDMFGAENNDLPKLHSNNKGFYQISQ